jgi:hypothetical protein
MHILATLPGKNSRFALRQFSRRALRCGGMVPEKISESPLPKTHARIREEIEKEGKEKEYGH